MYRVLRLAALSLAVFFGLLGCVPTTVTGQKFAAIDEPIGQLAIYVLEAKFERPYDTLELKKTEVSGNVDVEKFFPHLARRLPLVFSFNGIESKSVLSMAGKGFSTNYQYALTVVPQRVSWSSRRDTSLDVSCQIMNVKTQVKIWVGKISLETVGTGKYDEKIADVFAVKLLNKLRDDGILKLRAAEAQVLPPTSM